MVLNQDIVKYITYIE